MTGMEVQIHMRAGMCYAEVSGQLPVKRMNVASVTEERFTFPAQQTPCIQITHLVVMGIILVKRSLSTVVAFCLCALRRNGTSACRVTSGAISSTEQLFLSATNHPSGSLRNSVAHPAPCLISWETFLLYELPIYSL